MIDLLLSILNDRSQVGELVTDCKHLGDITINKITMIMIIIIIVFMNLDHYDHYYYRCHCCHPRHHHHDYDCHLFQLGFSIDNSNVGHAVLQLVVHCLRRVCCVDPCHLDVIMIKVAMIKITKISTNHSTSHHGTDSAGKPFRWICSQNGHLGWRPLIIIILCNLPFPYRAMLF